MRIEQHPDVVRYRQRSATAAHVAAVVLDAQELKQLARDCGADDAGLVAIERPELDSQRSEIKSLYPGTQTLLSFVCRMNREPIRNPARSIANLEFHHTGDEVNEVARRIVAALEERGVSSLNPAMGFPMEMSQFPGKIWVVSHKPVAVAAGLGMMGIHRNVIHPKFGNFILLGTILIRAAASDDDRPIDYNPCLGCKLCVAACPVGAIGADGAFDFASCYTHNYREFMGGFTDWVETIAASTSAADYRRNVTDSESASMWQSLAFGPNYKAAYCLSVCPAGEDVIGPYLEDQKQHLETIVRPLQRKAEPIYVVPGSDAEEFVRKRFPHKTVKRVQGGLRPGSIQQFLDSLPHVFQRGRAKGLSATYHFVFHGREPQNATIRIHDGQVHVDRELLGECQLRIRVDSDSWLGFLAGDRWLPWLLLTRRMILRGNPHWLLRFGRCFPR